MRKGNHCSSSKWEKANFVPKVNARRTLVPKVNEKSY